jgi:hypothetical protein
VKQWFTDYYGAANVVLVLAGEHRLATRRRRRRSEYFGHIASGPPLDRPGAWIYGAHESKRGEMETACPQPRVVRAGTCRARHRTSSCCACSRRCWAAARRSRLDARLTTTTRAWTGRGTTCRTLEIAGSVRGSTALVKNGVDPTTVEAAIEQEMKRLLRAGPTQSSSTARRPCSAPASRAGSRRLGGFGGKADSLAACCTYEGDPGCFRRSSR